MSSAKVKAAPAAAAAAAAVEEVAIETVETIGEVVEEAVDTVVKISTDAVKGYEKALGLTKEQADAAAKAQTAAYKSYEDIVQVAKDNAEALVKSCTILSRGLQDLAKSWVSYSQGALEDSVSATKTLMAAKTMREWVDLQSDLTKTALDKALSESTRLSDQSTKLVEEALAPITNRLNATLDKIVKAA